MIYGIYKLVFQQFFAPRDGFNGLAAFASSSLEKKIRCEQKIPFVHAVREALLLGITFQNIILTISRETYF